MPRPRHRRPPRSTRVSRGVRRQNPTPEPAPAQAELWGNEFSLTLTKRCLNFVATEVKTRGPEGVVGIQVCNEAVWIAKGLYEWYDSVISAISSIDNTLPVYTSDGWDLFPALEYSIRKNTTTTTTTATPTNPLVIDTHRYYISPSPTQPWPPTNSSPKSPPPNSPNWIPSTPETSSTPTTPPPPSSSPNGAVPSLRRPGLKPHPQSAKRLPSTSEARRRPVGGRGVLRRVETRPARSRWIRVGEGKGGGVGVLILVR